MKIAVTLSNARLYQILAEHFLPAFPKGAKVRLIKDESYIYWSLGDDDEATLLVTDDPLPIPPAVVAPPEFKPFYEAPPLGGLHEAKQTQETEQPSIITEDEIPF